MEVVAGEALVVVVAAAMVKPVVVTRAMETSRRMHIRDNQQVPMCMVTRQQL